MSPLEPSDEGGTCHVFFHVHFTMYFTMDGEEDLALLIRHLRQNMMRHLVTSIEGSRLVCSFGRSCSRESWNLSELGIQVPKERTTENNPFGLAWCIRSVVFCGYSTKREHLLKYLDSDSISRVFLF